MKESDILGIITDDAAVLVLLDVLVREVGVAGVTLQLSRDGGASFPEILAADLPNSGLMAMVVAGTIIQPRGTEPRRGLRGVRRAVDVLAAKIHDTRNAEQGRGGTQQPARPVTVIAGGVRDQGRDRIAAAGALAARRQRRR